MIEKGKQLCKGWKLFTIRRDCPIYKKQDGGGINKNGELGIPPEHNPNKKR